MLITFPDLTKPLKSLFFVGIALSTILNSCTTPHRPYHTGEASLLPSSPGTAPVAVIEFDERGDFWDPSQVGRADQMISTAAGNANPILVTYVHGWRHDARITDNDLKFFQSFLNQLNRGSKRPVCGVFIGWRGASVQEEGVTGLLARPSALLSFWGRKKITDQMAGVPFNNTVWRLAKTTQKNKGNSILIGHSFGGRIVERTLGPAAIAQMNNRQPMPYNLTFLINPASESLYARQLKLALDTWPEKSEPAIVVLAAEDDSATGKAWPLALLSPSGIRSRNYVVKGVGEESQRSYIRKTVGNDRRQWTHEVEEGQKKVIAPDINLVAENVRRGSDEFRVRMRGDKPDQATCCKIKPLSAVQAGHQLTSNAYWVIPLKKNILTGHGGVASENGIFSKSMGDLMAGIIGQVGAVTQEGAVVPVSNPANTKKSTAPEPVLTLPGLSIPLLQ